MPVCPDCGFDSGHDGGPCPLCGRSKSASREPDVVSTVSLGTDQAPQPRPPGAALRLAVGAVFAGRYRVDAFLGRGGMGGVFKVWDLEQGTPVALKVLLPSVTESPEAVERFKREIQMLGRIEHPVVPRVFGWGFADGEYYFTTAYVDGQNLRQVLREKGPWPPAAAAETVAAVAEALEAAHRLGIVHRDVKPHNIMLDRDGGVHLVDFGVARGVGLDLRTITASGMLVGTPEYMAPEQVDSHRVDHRSDLYSLGVVLFELLTGRPPFAGDTPMSVAWQHRTSQPPVPRSLRPEVPAWLERVVLRCLEKDPANRFDSAVALAAELRRKRSSGRVRRRRLPSGDLVVEDDAEVTDWALVLESEHEKAGWEEGIALRLSGRYYRLVQVERPASRSRRWVYRFAHWPAEEVLRRIVDYQQDCVEQAARRSTLGSRLMELVRKGRG